VFCVSCGIQLPDDANYCLKCGRPQKDGLRNPTQPKVEYREELLDWAKTPVFYDSNKKPPHQRSSDVANTVINNRVLHEIQPLLEQGWVLDGPFDTAVKSLWEQSNHLTWAGGSQGKVYGCRVKLRRIS
jgi:ribosomal protein L40E